MADEVFEAYSDTFEAVGNPYGMVINFNLSSPHMAGPYAGQPATVARIRLSWEMAKVLTFILLRYIKKAEADRGVSYPIPVEILNQLRIAKEDWDGLWASPKFKLGEDM